MTSMPEPAVLPVSLVETVTTFVRSQVLSGDLEPGERIVEETVCARLGVSRAPVREALRLLAQQGLIEHLPRRGFRVSEWSATDILQLFELRRVLEQHALSQALPLPVAPDPFDGIENALDGMRVAAGRDDSLARDDAHRRFHEAVVAIAGNRQLDLVYASVLIKLQLPMARNLRAEARLADPEDGIRRHAALLDAVRSNDSGVALAALESHGELTYLNLGIC
ncbi:GntR family transcriptional regulator [Aldersonia sp. NBC_00410]|jgi:DNA-binding GntR family transcriptional regulator|uniref:GntR family transcriptional regulator n=1 Tax=Aldersonia sp. NBC_00410 TaxID=2975954 RepID=UPI002252E69C|nr:GntR family transcriptional regulator [Aldersonia sp. NBC_00410]MCX5042909.1 GntR family transcriptional regulator [Aldersonia sp. NBC_00410]